MKETIKSQRNNLLISKLFELILGFVHDIRNENSLFRPYSPSFNGICMVFSRKIVSSNEISSVTQFTDEIPSNP